MRFIKSVKVIAKHCGEWEIDGNKGTSYYLITAVTGACKPYIEKCTKDIFDSVNVGASFHENAITYDRNGKIAYVKGGE